MKTGKDRVHVHTRKKLARTNRTAADQFHQRLTVGDNNKGDLTIKYLTIGKATTSGTFFFFFFFFKENLDFLSLLLTTGNCV